MVIYGLVDPREPERVRYVGKAKDLEKRRLEHIKDTKRGWKVPVSCWIRELVSNGIEPVALILKTTTTEQWQEDEQFFIATHAGPYLLNVRFGGLGHTSESATELWKKPEYRACISAAMKKRWDNPEERERLMATRWGDAETRDRHSEAVKKAWNDPEARDRMLATRSNPEAMARAGAASKERWDDPAYRARTMEKLLASRADPEFRKKQSAASKAAWADPEYRSRQTTAMKAAHARRRAEKAATINPNTEETSL